MKDPGRDNAIDRLLARTFRSTHAAEASGDCPDAEQLAAWCDEALEDSERATLETHIADCARCQAQLAAIARTTPAPSALPGRITWPQRWRWAVPAAAAATAVALWISTQPTPLLVPPTVATDAPAGALASAPDKPQDQPAESRDELKPSEVSRDRGDTSNKRARSRANQPPRQEPRAEGDSGRRSREGQVPAEPPVAAPPPVAAVPPPPPAEAGERRTLAETVTVTRAASAAARMLEPLEIVSSEPAVRWRIVGALIQRSSDRGKTWATQLTTRDVQLTAGASASPAVCWLVGRAGVVLLSTDGNTWRRLPFPEAIDLTAVKADSATTATVTTADGRQFATSDGGLTWK